MADFLIDGERLPPDSDTTRVYEAMCLLTNTMVNIKLVQSGNISQVHYYL